MNYDGFISKPLHKREQGFTKDLELLKNDILQAPFALDNKDSDSELIKYDEK